MTNKKEAPLAQLVEHLTLNQGVQGSNPWRRMIRSIRVNRVLFCAIAKRSVSRRKKKKDGTATCHLYLIKPHLRLSAHPSL